MNISVKLPEEIVQKIDELAKETETSKSLIIQNAVEIYSENIVDFQIALKRLNNPKDEILSNKEFKKLLNLINA